MLTYKGYLGKMEVDEDEGVIYGRVINLSKDGITFSGKTVEEAKEDFHNAVDDYLAWAEEEGFEPEKPYRGEFIVRVTPKLHREVATASTIINTSLNQFVIDAIHEKLEKLQRVLISTET